MLRQDSIHTHPGSSIVEGGYFLRKSGPDFLCCVILRQDSLLFDCKPL